LTGKQEHESRFAPETATATNWKAQHLPLIYGPAASDKNMHASGANYPQAGLRYITRRPAASP
jgi:hypothetical protein